MSFKKAKNSVTAEYSCEKEDVIDTSGISISDQQFKKQDGKQQNMLVSYLHETRYLCKFYL